MKRVKKIDTLRGGKEMTWTSCTDQDKGINAQ